MNYGKKITKVVTVGLIEAMAIMDTIKSNGQMFRIDFIKRSDGSIRTIVGRCGVKFAKTGDGAAYNFKDKGLISVFESCSGYRTIPVDGILGIKQGGVWYDFRDINRRKTVIRHVDGISGGFRTIPAFTSPLK